MDHGNGSGNEAGSSPDTVLARSSSDEDKRRNPESTSGEYITVAESSSSLDTLAGQSCTAKTTTVSTTGTTSSTLTNEEKKKKGRFGILKSSFKKDATGLFKMRKKNRGMEGTADGSIEQDSNPEEEKDSTRKKVQLSRQRQDDNDDKKTSSTMLGGTPSDSPGATSKKKKSHSLVRKLSFNKFRLSTDQSQQQSQQSQQQIEVRRTPDGGDSSQSQSQSSQDSPSHSDSPKKLTRKGSDGEKSVFKGIRHRSKADSERPPTGEREREKKGETKKPEMLIAKPVSTVTVVQRRSPSLTIRCVPKSSQQHESSDQSSLEQERKTEIYCTSTLPYAISKWPDQRKDQLTPELTRKMKLSVKADSDCGTYSTKKTSPVELRRKLSLLEEKRAIFQRRLFESTTSDIDSNDTVIAVTLDEEFDKSNKTRSSINDSGDDTSTKKKARHISVRKFDTFSTFEGTFDEDTGLGYLAGIEEDYPENYDREDDDYNDLQSAMAPMLAAANDNVEKTRSVSQESASSQNNAPSIGVGEKREHLYKILVIGELGAGKTSIIKRYVHQFFSQHYRATIGVDFALKVLNWDPHTIIRLQLWDIAGQERFGNMTRVYYKEAVGAFIVFDVTRNSTLDAVVKWKQDLDSKVQLPDGSPIPCVLLANKCDQQKEGLVNSPNKMDEYCKEKKFVGWFETSAKENINIEEAAKFLVNKILQNDQIMKGNESQDQTDGERFALNQSPVSSKKSCSC
ncbi:EF-hand calcium-binding domain-containing protein 4B isoform X1 [Polistes fuscatus]|uniref:EF-hand calcium-binding domain-containing protein 4B isoform X1 n=1 Tax=Polistes fuscatus TaxID=30207 RepID=UPI001CA905F4|nr:EF-hand calcium-binding domain-containing protein 4B isoform X1 [Polistes fuscatus]